MSFSKQDFSKIYDEYYPKIVRYLTRVVGESEAEDAAQETFVKIVAGNKLNKRHMYITSLGSLHNN